MSTFNFTTFNFTAARAETEEAFHVINGVRESRIVYTLAAVALAAVIMSGFVGRKVLQRIFWFLDGILGGAPRTVELPGPSGLPLIGNLTHVSCSYKYGLYSSNCCV